MKKLILLVVLACCVVASFAVPLPEGSDARITEVRQSNGKIVYVRLKEATTLNTPLGALDAVEEVFFYENGNIQKFQPAVSGEYVSPVGNLTYTTAPISFYESGAVEEMELAKKTDITGSVGRIKVAGKTITFYDNWIPSSVELSEDCQVKLKSGVVSARSGYRMFFHENGAIQSFTVSKSEPLTSSIGKIYPQEGSVMELHPNGSLATVSPEDICMVTVDETLYFTKARSPIAFRDGGQVLRFSAEAQDFTFGKFKFTLESGSTEMFVYDDGSVFFTNPGYVHLAGLEYRRHCNGLFVSPIHNRLIYWEESYNDTSVYNYSYNDENRLVSTSLNMNILQYTPDTMKYFDNAPFTFDQESNVTSYLGFEKRKDPETKTSYNHPVIVKVAIRPNARVPMELQQPLQDEPVIPTPQPVEPILNEK
jgi:hypothetical protein